MLQIDLVPNEHDDNAWVSMITELLQPFSGVYEGRVLGDVVHQ